MADFRFYCEKHNAVYTCMRNKKGHYVLVCRQCIEEAGKKDQFSSPVAYVDAPDLVQQNERKNDAEEMK